MADHHPEELAPVEARIAAIEAVLVEKGILDVDAVDAIVAHFEDNLGPMNGAKVVARAWADPEYKARLLTSGTAAIAELGFGGPEGEHMVVVQGTGVPRTGGAGTAQAARGDGHGDPGRRRDPGVGLQRGGALPRAADAPRRYRRSVRGTARGRRDA